MSSRFYNDKNKRVTYTVEDRTYEIDKKSEKIPVSEIPSRPKAESIVESLKIKI